MEKLKRAIFFWVLVTLFFITAPGVVLYARGYRFDSNRGVFVHSGTITAKTNPQNMDVKINGEIRESKKLNRINSSYNITGLIPGSYDIEVSADGFWPWKKKTEVHSGLATEFWNILLVRKSYEKTTYDTPGIDKFFSSPFNKFIAYTNQEDNQLKVNVFDIENEEGVGSISIPGWELAGSERKENMEWSPEENLISIPVARITTLQKETKIGRKVVSVTEEKQTQYHYLIANHEEETFFDLNDFLGIEEMRYVRWDPEKKEHVFFLSGTNLYRASIQDKNDRVLVDSDVTAFDLSRSGIYFVKKTNNLVFKRALDGAGEVSQLTHGFPDAGDKTIERLVVYDEDRIAMIASDKSFYSYNDGEHDVYFKKLGANVDGLHYSDDGKKLLFWTPNEISVYFIRDWEVQPVRAENDVMNITRFSEKLTNVQWYKDYEHVIFNSGRYTKIIEIDHRDFRNSMDLLSTELEKPFVVYNNALEILYFTEKKDNTTTLNSIIFPEPVPVLGLGG